MYNNFFGLTEAPFSIAPDPRYLYMSEQHREALAHLLFGFSGNGGFVLLTGEVGTGKTTVCRCLLEQIPQNTAIAFIFNPKLTVEELLATVCDEFGIKYPDGNKSIKVFTDILNSFLLDIHANGQKAVLIIDEAQNLENDVLEQLRLLSNLETSQHKLLQVMLLGQPELRERLSDPVLKQLSQRIIARYHLGPLSRSDVHAYTSHRLSVAGAARELFSHSAINKVYAFSRGIPRLINIICDRALLGAYAGGKNKVDTSTVKQAAREVLGGQNQDSDEKRSYIWVAAFMIIFIISAVMTSGLYNKEASLLPASEQQALISETPDAATPQMWPEDQPLMDSYNSAFRELFSLWGKEYASDSGFTACGQAESHGLKCLDSLGSLEQLLNLNRPAVLKLYNSRGSEYYASLTSVQDETATLSVSASSYEVSLDDLHKYWLGNYILLWKPPHGYKGLIKSGDSGSAYEWVKRGLALAGAILSADDKSLSDAGAFESQMKRFQLSRGLVPDGIAGAHTIIHLNSITGAGVPVLVCGHITGPCRQEALNVNHP